MKVPNCQKEKKNPRENTLAKRGKRILCWPCHTCCFEEEKRENERWGPTQRQR